MKKRIIFIVFAIGMAMASCNQNEWTQEKDSAFSSTRAEEWVVDYEALDTACFVSESDIEAYIHFKQLLAKSKGSEFEVNEVIPLGLDDRATLCYLLNYNEGWEIVAADKRAPVVLATGETGNFSVEEAPDNVMAWIESLETDVLYLRTFEGRPEAADDDTWEKMLTTMDFWKAINADEEYIEGGEKKDSIHEGPITRGYVDPSLIGHWELIGTQEVRDYYVVVPHLTSVTMHQSVPYNSACPYRSDYSYLNAPAGCLAVSGAVLLNFLHWSIGRPLTSPISASCSGDITNYQFTFGSLSSSSWTEINNGNTSYAAALIAYIGSRVNMNYGNELSVALTDDFISGVLSPDGITCTDMSYNPDTVSHYIIQGQPILTEAHYSSSQAGHSFLIDAYQKYKVGTRYTYRWVYDVPSTGPRPFYENDVITIWQDDLVEQIKMRWGDSESYDDTWYPINGSWMFQNLNFNINRRMVYNFKEQ